MNSPKWMVIGGVLGIGPAFANHCVHTEEGGYVLLASAFLGLGIVLRGWWEECHESK